MAKLLIKTAGLGRQLIELKLGVNRVGRASFNDFQILHPTISSSHCEFILSDAGVTLRDLKSTNGTFVNGEPAGEVQLSAGQLVRLGEVELLVETTDVNVAIPKFANLELPAPPVVASDGAMICPRHPHGVVTHRCTVCKEVMCNACVHRLRRKGSRILLELCPICSSPVEPIGTMVMKKKKSLLERVTETVRLKWTGIIRR